ncbi:DNA N-6-adenine-methyltransferase [Leifsonia sp. McL0607]|uniref:DNA N-6-adenine-methyltransferase n=1 Tax=Leifsonia sp. McL0607 TaxID=3415672 RepID=UPI003CF92024
MSTLPLFAAPVDRTETDERYTPRWIFDALGETFDLDPASPVDAETNVPARAAFTRNDDGLAQPWHGFVWLNPPFSNSTPWSERFLEHADGIWLGPHANARWLHRMLCTADSIWLMRDFAFDHPTHAGKRSSMPLTMFGYGDRAARALARAAHAAPDVGVLVSRSTETPELTIAGEQ